MGEIGDGMMEREREREMGEAVGTAWRDINEESAESKVKANLRVKRRGM